jgi:hypothetical protein
MRRDQVLRKKLRFVSAANSRAFDSILFCVSSEEVSAYLHTADSVIPSCEESRNS